MHKRLTKGTFIHRFVNTDDEFDVLGTRGSWPAAQFAFHHEDEIKFPNFATQRFPAEHRGVTRFLMLHVDGRVVVIYAPVKALLGIGSTENDLLFYARENGFLRTFCGGGEIRPKSPGVWDFNIASSEIESRFHDLVEDQERLQKRPERVFRDMKVYSNMHTFVGKELERQNPGKKFKYSPGYYETDNVPFRSIAECITNASEMPLVAPYDGQSPSFVFDMAIGAFKSTRERTPNSLKIAIVNSWAGLSMVQNLLDQNIPFGPYLEEVGKDPKPKSKARFINWNVKDDKEVVLMNEDIASINAKRFLRDMGTTLYKPGRERPVVSSFTYDYFHVENQTWDVYINRKKRTLIVQNAYPCHGLLFYNVVVDGEPCRLLTMGKSEGYRTGHTAQILMEEFLLNRDLPHFVIPNRDATGLLLPVIPGRPVSEIPYEERQAAHAYEHFKLAIWNGFYLSHIDGGFKPSVTDNNDILYYNRNITPDNVLKDDTNTFHVINPREVPTTPEWYGPGGYMYSLRGQLFGLLLVAYWFKTDERPFKHDSSDAAKYRWVKNLPEGTRAREMFETVLDDGIPEEDVKWKVHAFFNQTPAPMTAITDIKLENRDTKNLFLKMALWRQYEMDKHFFTRPQAIFVNESTGSFEFQKLQAIDMEWYGPLDLDQSPQTIHHSVFFGLLLVAYWFATDERPFQRDQSDEAKYRWVSNLPEGTRAKRMFDAALDRTMDPAYCERTMKVFFTEIIT
jgi:hypothetical protein